MLVQKPVPEPGPAEVLVRVDAIAVCATDIEVLEHGLPAMVDGELPFNRGFTPGHEWMGTIVGLGPTDRREQLMDFDLFASEYGFSAGATRPISLEATRRRCSDSQLAVFIAYRPRGARFSVAQDVRMGDRGPTTLGIREISTKLAARFDNKPPNRRYA